MYNTVLNPFFGTYSGFVPVVDYSPGYPVSRQCSDFDQDKPGWDELGFARGRDVRA